MGGDISYISFPCVTQI